MKSNTLIKKLSTSIVIIIISILYSSESIAQEKISSDLGEFKITIEKSDNGLKLKSEKGSSWIDLNFSLANMKPQAINEYGMTQLKEVSNSIDPELADYLFTITKTNEGITLTGIKGTAWKELSFSLEMNSKQAIDQFGMIK